MIRPLLQLVLGCSLALFATACGGVTIHVAPAPVRHDSVLLSAKIAEVVVETSGAIQGDKYRLISKNKVPAKMSTALMDVLAREGKASPGAADAPKVFVDITEMRLPHNALLGGPDHLAGIVTVVDAAGTKLKSFEVRSTTSGAFAPSRTSRFSHVLSDFSQKVLAGL